MDTTQAESSKAAGKRPARDTTADLVAKQVEEISGI